MGMHLFSLLSNRLVYHLSFLPCENALKDFINILCSKKFSSDQRNYARLQFALLQSTCKVVFNLFKFLKTKKICNPSQVSKT
jgi:hypothetical protein